MIVSIQIFGLVKLKKKVSQNILLFKTKKFFEYYISSSPIPWILLNEKKRNIRILDFGSGFQEVFFQLINSKNMNNIIIDSIEKENIKKNIIMFILVIPCNIWSNGKKF